jgi:hypothetical protein
LRTRVLGSIRGYPWSTSSFRSPFFHLNFLAGLPEGYTIHKPSIHFSDLDFVHSRSVLLVTKTCVEGQLACFSFCGLLAQNILRRNSLSLGKRQWDVPCPEERYET